MSVRVKALYLYPIKSLDAIQVSEATVTAQGALQHDRQFAFFRDDQPVNGKKAPDLMAVRTVCNLQTMEVHLTVDNINKTFNLLHQPEAISQLISDYLGYPVTLRQAPETGFPDDRDAWGPTIIGSATLTALHAEFPFLDENELYRRFRTNILLETSTPLWEDHLFDTAIDLRAFTLGDIQFSGINPCKRCGVPARDSSTGEMTQDFARQLIAWREQNTPTSSTALSWPNSYRIAVNTRIPHTEGGKILKAGDAVTPSQKSN